MLWGLTYALNEKMLERVSVSTTLAIGAAALLLCMTALSMQQGVLLNDLHAIITSKSLFRITIISTLTYVAADWMIASAIQSQNATLASIIEISYPLFIVLFTFLLYKKIDVTPMIAAGGALIIIGAALVLHGTRT